MNPGPIEQAFLTVAKDVDGIASVSDREGKKLGKLPMVTLELLGPPEKTKTELGPNFDYTFEWNVRVYARTRREDWTAKDELDSVSSRLVDAVAGNTFLSRGGPVEDGSLLEAVLDVPRDPPEKDETEGWVMKRLHLTAHAYGP